MKETPFRYDYILSQIRRDIVMGIYPVGTSIKSVQQICREYNVGVETGYKIHRILENEGLVKYVERKGSIVIPFDQVYWQNKVQKEAVQSLAKALSVCKQSQVSKNQIASIIYSEFCQNMAAG